MIIDIIINIVVYTLKVLMFFYDLINTIEDFAKESKIIFPIILSVIAAVIFWFIFSYLPTNKRKKKLRPIIEFDLVCLNQALTNIFQTIIGKSPYFDENIYSGNLTKKDFYIALQNKCLTEYDLYDTNVSSHYEIIGLKLAEKFENANNIINKILIYNEFVEAEELLLLNEISHKIKICYINEKIINYHIIDIENGNRPTISNLCSKYQRFYDLYELYKELNEITFKNDYYDNYNVALFQNIKYLYNTEKYKECKKVIKKRFNENKKLRHHYSVIYHFELLCNLKLNKIDYKKLEKVLKERHFAGGLVYLEESIEVLENDRKFLKLVNKYYQEEEINNALTELKEVLKEREKYTETNTEISKYMEELDTSLKDINWN